RHLGGVDLLVAAVRGEVLQRHEHADDGDDDPQPRAAENALDVHDPGPWPRPPTGLPLSNLRRYTRARRPGARSLLPHIVPRYGPRTQRRGRRTAILPARRAPRVRSRRYARQGGVSPADTRDLPEQAAG